MRSLVVTNMFPSEADPHAGIFVQREVEALRVQGIDVDVCHIDTPSESRRYFTSRPLVSRRIAETDPDVVHVHFGLTLGVVPRSAPPVVATFHGSDLTEGWKRIVSRTFAGHIAAAVVVAPKLAGYLEGLDIPVTVIPEGVPVDRFQPMAQHDARLEVGMAPDATVALFPASPRRRVKRYRLFADAMAQLPGVTAVCLDGIPPAQVRKYLSAADVVVLTSEREGSPVVTKEAVCVGTRVVSVDVGDVAWQLEGMQGCVVADEPTADSVAAAVLEALASPGPDPAMAQRRFDIALTAEAVTRVYESVLHV